jgi:hypothetical protein
MVALRRTISISNTEYCFRGQREWARFYEPHRTRCGRRARRRRIRLGRQDDLAEHSALLHVLVGGTRVFQRKSAADDGFQSAGECVT